MKTKIMLLMMFMLLVACAPIASTKQTYVVEVTGTAGTEFTGSVGGGGSTRTVDGTIPATYKIEGWPAVAVVQKMQETGSLIVTIKQGTKVLDSQITSAKYGVVTATSG